MKGKKQTGQRIFDYVIMGIVILISLFPFLWVLLSSFKTNSQILFFQLFSADFILYGWLQDRIGEGGHYLTVFHLFICGRDQHSSGCSALLYGRVCAGKNRI